LFRKAFATIARPASPGSVDFRAADIAAFYAPQGPALESGTGWGDGLNLHARLAFEVNEATPPRDPEIDRRKQRFDELNEFVQARGGWLTSVPGAHEISFDALVGSALPEQLAALGYIVEKIGESQRILAHAVAQKFETSSSGVPVPVTEGSTKPVTVTGAR
jgi:hypothetical protein